MDAIIEQPYPDSELIEKVEFAPVSSIVRKARGMKGKQRYDGSDNWPITWADDDNLYTAYGDGYGFKPYTDVKLGLGFAKVIGEPDDFNGVNIRSETGENRGYGANGVKASGMLMVDEVIYIWGRNARNSQLAWSTDYCQTWTWSDWKFTESFGCPTFLNFCKNYAGARDEYVYVYSQDVDDAYTPADRLVLARVLKDRIRNREAYEFFKSLDPEGNPIWTKEIVQRVSVFEFPGKCYRSGISYNPGLERYLLCQFIPGGETRFEGGFGIYESPEPWGPWRTVYFTLKWDVGPGESSSFPTKWMSTDGKTCYLVFSGDDAFSVRKVTFVVSEDK